MDLKRNGNCQILARYREGTLSDLVAFLVYRVVITAWCEEIGIRRAWLDGTQPVRKIHFDGSICDGVACLRIGYLKHHRTRKRFERHRDGVGIERDAEASRLRRVTGRRHLIGIATLHERELQGVVIQSIDTLTLFIRHFR